MTRREKRIIDVINDVDRYKASYYFDIEFDDDDRTYVIKKHYHRGKVYVYAYVDETSAVREKYRDYIK